MDEMLCKSSFIINYFQYLTNNYELEKMPAEKPSFSLFQLHFINYC